MRNFKLLLAYDGTRYQGWQRQGNTAQTIQGKVEAVLSRLLDAPIEISGSGRTDAGAHARGQVANFHADTERSPSEILAALRQYLPADIGVLEVCEVEPRFHARLCARQKTYVYRVWNSDAPNVFERNYVYQISAPLDVEAMRNASNDFLGTHDFQPFCSNKRSKKSTVRTVYDLRIDRREAELRFTITGDGFLYNMVRIMVGTLLEIGRHQLDAGCIPAIFASGSRESAGPTAPAQGLCLMEVFYE